MTLSKKESIFVISDVIGPVLCTSVVLLKYYMNKINYSLFLTYFFGILIGCLWEIPFGLLGNHFLKFTFDNPLGFGVFVLHAFWDSLIFLVGLYLVHIRNNNRYSGLKQLSLMILWGVFQNFIVELLFNNNYWYYGLDNRYNPVLFTINDNSFTFLPFLVWIISPILYISGVFSLIEKYGPLRGTIKEDATSRSALLRPNDIYATNTDNSDENVFYTSNPVDINLPRTSDDYTNSYDLSDNKQSDNMEEIESVYNLHYKLSSATTPATAAATAPATATAAATEL